MSGVAAALSVAGAAGVGAEGVAGADAFACAWVATAAAGVAVFADAGAADALAGVGADGDVARAVVGAAACSTFGAGVLAGSALLELPGFGAPGLDADVDPVVGLAAADPASGVAVLAGNASLRRFATGGSIVDEGLLTYSPSSVSFAINSLLGTPSSLAISLTRGFVATNSPVSGSPEQGKPLAVGGSHFEPLIVFPLAVQPVLYGDECLKC